MQNSKFDTLIHAPNRLQICALLSPVEQMEFRVIRDEVGVSDSVLSKHLKQLEDVDYIKQIKSKVNRRERRWFHLTTKGRKAFELHIKELKRIVGEL
jgi:DNA-binding MarR family transcriptional regulator